LETHQLKSAPFEHQCPESDVGFVVVINLVPRNRWNRKDSKLEAIYRLAEQIGLEEKPVQKLVKVAIATENFRVREQIEKRLTAMAAKQQIQPFKDHSLVVAPEDD
jgi:hypothetical protein